MTEAEVIHRAFATDARLRDLLGKLFDSGQLQSSSTLDPQDELHIILGPTSGNIDGSKQVLCGCGSAVWLSLTSQQLIAKHVGPIRLSCLPCAVAALPSGLDKVDA